MVPHWQTPYLGTRFLPKRLSGWEIDHFFTLEPEERDDICKRFRGLNRLAVALQLGFLRMTGCTLDGVRILHRNLLEHIGAQGSVAKSTLSALMIIFAPLFKQQWPQYDQL